MLNCVLSVRVYSVCPSVCLSVCPSVCLLSVRLFACLSVCLPLSLSVSVSLFLSRSRSRSRSGGNGKRRSEDVNINIVTLAGFVSTMSLSFPVLRFTARVFAYIITTRASWLLYRGNRYKAPGCMCLHTSFMCFLCGVCAVCCPAVEGHTTRIVRHWIAVGY